MQKFILVALLALLYLGCAASPQVEPELKEEPATAAPQEAPADSKRRSMDEGGIGGTGNSDCNEGKTPESDCQEPRP